MRSIAPSACNASFRVGTVDPLRCARLRHDDADVVGDDIVELPRDHPSFLGDRSFSQDFSVMLQLRGPVRELQHLPPSHAEAITKGPRRADDQALEDDDVQLHGLLPDEQDEQDHDPLPTPATMDAGRSQYGGRRIERHQEADRCERWQVARDSGTGPGPRRSRTGPATVFAASTTKGPSGTRRARSPAGPGTGKRRRSRLRAESTCSSFTTPINDVAVRIAASEASCTIGRVHHDRSLPAQTSNARTGQSGAVSRPNCWSGAMTDPVPFLRFHRDRTLPPLPYKTQGRERILGRWYHRQPLP